MLDAKIATISCYRSQLNMLGWNSPALLAAELRTMTANDGGECEWLLTPRLPRRHRRVRLEQACTHWRAGRR